MSNKSRHFYLGALLVFLCSQAFPAVPPCGDELNRFGKWLDKKLGSLQVMVRRSSRGSVKMPQQDRIDAVKTLLSSHPFPAPIPVEKVQDVARLAGLSIAELVDIVGILVRPHSLPTLSGFYVGAAAYVSEGSAALPTGSIIFGNNLELPGNLMTAGTCAEAALLGRATVLGVRRISYLSVWGGVGPDGAPLPITPCSHCRQILNELEAAHELRIRVAGRPVILLDDLFPDPFGPKDLGIDGGLLAHEHRTPAVVSAGDLNLSEQEISGLRSAADAAAKAYVPYSNTEFGIALVACKPDGRCFTAQGADMEGANFHGTKSALTSAISDLASTHAQEFRSTADAVRSIQAAYLFERSVDPSKPILKSSIDSTVTTLRSLQRHMFPEQPPIRIYRSTVDGTTVAP